ncbi:E3 ubiquitin-protein ligase rnf213-alpha-like [Glandiceps talaboti]
MFMRKAQNECSFVSLRDVERTMDVMQWFLNKLTKLNPLLEAKPISTDNMISWKPTDNITKSLILALGVCYHACLQDNRKAYREEVAQSFREPCELAGGGLQMLKEISRCQDVFLDAVYLGPNIARNTALKENVFMMVVCLELRIPLFLVGKPGCSKSLAKTIVSNAMQGANSENDLFKDLKKVNMMSFQCSQLSTPEGIIDVFRLCGQQQKKSDLNSFTSTVVLEEVGLAEDSPKMPLKTLHPLLEYGCEDDTDVSPEERKVGFIGISNWALDPAKMNRGILVSRPELDEDELVASARGICDTDVKVLQIIDVILPHLAKAYLKVYKEQPKEFFGLRDFYSLIKMVFAFTKTSDKFPSWSQLKHAVLRNFGGLSEIDPVKIFRDALEVHIEEHSTETNTDCTTMGLIRASLGLDQHIVMAEDSRYLLILTENYAALGILQQEIHQLNNPVVIFGSSFPRDQEYTQICRNIHRIKTCMENGRNVILLNLDKLYESLYDTLNQYYLHFGGQRYVDIGLGTLRKKCRVHKDFKLVVVAERQIVYERFPIPLINRLEKHFLAMDTILMKQQLDIVKRLKKWANDFATIKLGMHDKRRINFTVCDAFVGYNSDTPASIVLQVCALRAKEKKADKEDWSNEVFNTAANILLQCATPDAVARLSKSLIFQSASKIWHTYFHDQTHGCLASFLKTQLETRRKQKRKDDLLLQVTTHTRLLSKHDVDEVRESLGIQHVHAISLQEFQTEQQFTSKVREYFNVVSSKEKVLLIQCAMGNENINLIACSRYILLDERAEAAKRVAESGKLMSTHVVFIIQLPYIAGGCFDGFQGGNWLSVHIDELRQPLRKRPEVVHWENQSISDMFEMGITEYMNCKEGENIDIQKNGGNFALDTQGVIRTCLHSACGMLEDHEDNLERGSHRVGMLLKKFESRDGNRFWEVVQKRMLELLKQKDEKVTSKTAWLCNEASSGQRIQESGTFRSVLRLSKK